jgi:hypothetical protein
MGKMYHNVPRFVEQTLYAMLPRKEHKHIDKYLFVLSTVRTAYTFNKKELEYKHNGYAPIPRSVWQNILGKGYKKYISNLEQWNLLLLNAKYLPKVFDKSGTGQSMKYKLGPDIENLAPTNISVKSTSTLKNLLLWKDKDVAYIPATPEEVYLKEQLNDFSIDPKVRLYIESQIQFNVNYVESINNKIEQIRDRERYLWESSNYILKCPNFLTHEEHTHFRVILPPVCKVLMPMYRRKRYPTDITLINSIEGGYPLFKRGEHGSRLFTTFNMMARELRQFWRHKSGHKLVESDFSNSQPLMLCTLFSEWFDGNIPPDAIHYRHLCETGQFYEYMARVCGSPLNLMDDTQRSRFKATVFGLIFFCKDPAKIPKWQRARYNNAITKGFEKAFPNVYRLICDNKPKQHYQRLAIEMQKRERKVIVDHVVAKLIEQFNGQIPLLTIHDSIVTTEPFAWAVKDQMCRSMNELHGINPKVNTKIINTPPIASYLPLQ